MHLRLSSIVLLVALMFAVLPRSGSALPQAQPAGAALAASEDEKSRPSKEDIIGLLAKIGKMSAQQQSARMDAIAKRQSASQTPRSDFLFCLGLAYMGQSRAQICVGNAYENGLGVVEDATDAFVWYSIALEGKITDASKQESTRVSQQRVKGKLVQNYPSPSDEELEATVNAEKSRIRQFQAPRK